VVDSYQRRQYAGLRSRPLCQLPMQARVAPRERERKGGRRGERRRGQARATVGGSQQKRNWLVT